MQDARPAPTGCTSADKWQVLDALAVARDHFGLRHSDIAVLSAVISFHPKRTIDTAAATPIVFASNRALCDRLNGMPDSTMRRHLSRLMDAGLLSRQDSPNGKRYVRRGRDGTVLRAFGFDLSPLAVRAPEIDQAAIQAQAQADALALLRETASLMRRDLEAALDGAEDLCPDLLDRAIALMSDSRTALRRKPQTQALNALGAALTGMLSAVRDSQGIPCAAEEMSSSPPRTEQHYQMSYKEISDSEKRGQPNAAAQAPAAGDTCGTAKSIAENEDVSLGEVVASCPTVQEYYPQAVTRWQDLEDRAGQIAPMLGVGADVVHLLCEALGRQRAAVTILCVLERVSEIRNPAGYLRRLAQNARSHGFDLRALLRSVQNRAKHLELSADNIKSSRNSYA